MKIQIILALLVYTTVMAMDGDTSVGAGPRVYILRTVEDVKPFLCKFVILSREGSNEQACGYVTPCVQFPVGHPLEHTVHNGFFVEKIVLGRVAGTLLLSNFTLDLIDRTWSSPHSKLAAIYRSPLTVRLLTHQEFNQMLTDVREHRDLYLQRLLRMN